MLGHHTGFIVSFDVMLLICSATLGRGSTGGMVREPRHRPLLLVSYHSWCQYPRVRECPPLSQLAGALAHPVSDDRDPQWYRNKPLTYSLWASNRCQSIANNTYLNGLLVLLIQSVLLTINLFHDVSGFKTLLLHCQMASKTIMISTHINTL